MRELGAVSVIAVVVAAGLAMVASVVIGMLIDRWRWR